MKNLNKIISKKVDPEDYEKFVNSIHQKMKEESNGRLPTFKECVTAIKRFYRLEMGKVLPKRYKFQETSGNRHTWCRRDVWKINTNRKSIRSNFSGWEDIIHSACHWIEYRKYGSDAKIHNLNSFRMEKRFVEYAYENKWHLGSLVKQAKPKVEISKDALMIDRLKKNISSWETKIKRAETYIKKYSKKLKYYEKKVAEGVIAKPRAKGYKIESYKQKAERLLELNPNIELDPFYEYGDEEKFFPCRIFQVNDKHWDYENEMEWCSSEHEHYSWKPLYEEILYYSVNK